LNLFSTPFSLSDDDDLFDDLILPAIPHLSKPLLAPVTEALTTKSIPDSLQPIVNCFPYDPHVFQSFLSHFGGSQLPERLLVILLMALVHRVGQADVSGKPIGPFLDLVRRLRRANDHFFNTASPRLSFTFWHSR
jgi:hypothetical protein